MTTREADYYVGESDEPADARDALAIAMVICMPVVLVAAGLALGFACGWLARMVLIN